MDSAGLASIIREGLFTKFFDSAGAASWRGLIATLKRRGETLHAKGVAWISLFHPLVAGRKGGAMALINMYDFSDPKEVAVLLAIDNDCLRKMFVELAEGGFLVKYAIAPHLAGLFCSSVYFLFFL
jgi:hypothetical protein